MFGKIGAIGVALLSAPLFGRGVGRLALQGAFERAHRGRIGAPLLPVRHHRADLASRHGAECADDQRRDQRQFDLRQRKQGEKWCEHSNPQNQLAVTVEPAVAGVEHEADTDDQHHDDAGMLHQRVEQPEAVDALDRFERPVDP